MIKGFIVFCDVCGVSIDLRSAEQEEIHYESWISGITYDICPEHKDGELSPELKCKIRAEEKLFNRKSKRLTDPA